MDGVIGKEAISEHWAGIYEKLFTTPQSYSHEESVKSYIRSGRYIPLKIEQEDIAKAIYKLKIGKCAGSEGIQAEHYKYSASAIVPLITDIIGSMIAHGFVPLVHDSSDSAYY